MCLIHSDSQITQMPVSLNETEVSNVCGGAFTTQDTLSDFLLLLSV